MASEFNHTCEGELKIEVDILFNGRRRVTRRFPLKKNENVDDVIFAAYGAQDPAQVTACTTGYSNLRLVSQKVVPIDRGISFLAQIFETLTSELVAEGEAVLGRDTNDVLVAKVPYIGLPGATGGLAVGDAFTVGGVPCVVSEVEIQENDAFKRVTYVAREVGTGVEGAGEKQIGGDEVVVDSNDRHTMTRRFSQAASAPYVAGVIGSTVTSDGVVYVLAQETKTESASTRSTVRVYLEATGTWTPVGPDKQDRDMNGLLRVRMQLVAKAGTTPPELVVGSSDYSSGGVTVYLARMSDAESDEAVSRIVVEYLEPGEVASSVSYSNNGALETRSSSWFFASPATPTGFVVVGTQETNVNGYPTVEYRFAKGIGEVSRTMQGREDGTVISVRALSAPGAANPVSTPTGYVIVESTSTEADGHRVWTVQFAKGNDVVDYDMNGLKRRTVTTVYAAGATVADLTVGESTHPTDTVLILARLKDVENDANITRTAVYLKPGVLSKSSAPGDIPGTTKNTWQTWLVDPTDASAMTAAGAGSPLTGKKFADNTENVQGYPVRSVSTLSGTITGVKTTYKDVTEVLTPGKITPTTITTPQGSVAELLVEPPRRKTIPITVTVEVTTSPPNTTPTLAYNLEDISCAATRTSYSYSGNGQRVLSNADGTNRFKGERWSAGVSGNTQTFPACYYTAESSTGTVQFVSDWYDASSDDSSIVATSMDTTITTHIKCSGASAPGSKYLTSGLLQRKVRPIFTALDGTIYWEVVSFTA